MAQSALKQFRANRITHLIVEDYDHNYVGILHLHDLSREGII